MSGFCIESGFDILPIAILVINKKMDILFSNIKANELFGYKKKEKLFNLKNYFNSDSPLFDLITRSKKSKSPISDENLKISTPYLSKTSFISNISFLEGSNYEKQIIILIRKGMANSSNLEQSTSISLNTVTGFNSMLAHEVKNPLSGIKGAAQLLSSELVNSESRVLTKLIVQETDRICELLDKVDNLFSDILIEPLIINIHEIIQHCIKISKSGFAKEVIFIEKFDPSIPTILGDKNILIQTFLNLIKNASEATNGTGRIEIITYFGLWDPISINQGKEKRISPIHIEITDNGKGVPEHLRDNIFNPFFTSKHKGSGLGLSQVFGAMNAHGGKVELISERKKTTFRLSFPVKEID